MDGDAIGLIQQSVKAPTELGGFLYRPSGWVVDDPKELVKAGPQAKTLAVSTLGAIRDYLQANKDALDMTKIVVHVASPNGVYVLGPLDQRSRVREAYTAATCVDSAEGFLGRFMSLEEFIIGLQVRFADGEDRKRVLLLMGNVKHEVVKTSLDDGVTQGVQARSGVTMVADAVVPNPVQLVAYRSFRDIVQPSSLYILRVQAGKSGGLPEAGLFEADGGAWRLTAVDRVRDWLVAALPKDVAVLG